MCVFYPFFIHIYCIDYRLYVRIVHHLFQYQYFCVCVCVRMFPWMPQAVFICNMMCGLVHVYANTGLNQINDGWNYEPLCRYRVRCRKNRRSSARTHFWSASPRARYRRLRWIFWMNQLAPLLARRHFACEKAFRMRLFSAARHIQCNARNIYLVCARTIHKWNGVLQRNERPCMHICVRTIHCNETIFKSHFCVRVCLCVQETMEETGSESASGDHDKTLKRRRRYIQKRRTVVNPDENFHFYWLMMVTVCVLYNLWTLIVRQSFPELQVSEREEKKRAQSLTTTCECDDVVQHISRVPTELCSHQTSTKYNLHNNIPTHSTRLPTHTHTGITAALLEHLRPFQWRHFRAGHNRSAAHRLFGAGTYGEFGI